MCFKPILESGLRRFCSFCTIHNRLLDKFPAQLKHLYQPVYWVRQAEHTEEQPVVPQAALFRYEYEFLWIRTPPNLIMKVYDVAQILIERETIDHSDPSQKRYLTRS